jgi:hypothetical protein
MMPYNYKYSRNKRKLMMQTNNLYMFKDKLRKRKNKLLFNYNNIKTSFYKRKILYKTMINIWNNQKSYNNKLKMKP